MSVHVRIVDHISSSIRSAYPELKVIFQHRVEVHRTLGTIVSDGHQFAFNLEIWNEKSISILPHDFAQCKSPGANFIEGGHKEETNEIIIIVIGFVSDKNCLAASMAGAKPSKNGMGKTSSSSGQTMAPIIGESLKI